MLANRGRALSAAERGDRDAFLGLYDQFGPMLYRFFFWLTGSEAEARELVVAAFRRAFHSFGKRPRTMVLDTWFYRVAVRTFLASTRWQMFSRRATGAVEIEDRSTPWRAAVIALPPKLRVVWLLTLAEGMPQSQTAEAVRASLDRVESLLDRGRAAFRAPDPDADRAAIERAMRQLTAPRPGATLRAEVAATLGTGVTAVRTRVIQAGIGAMVLALVGSIIFSLLRDEEGVEPGPEQADAQPMTIVVLGVADSGAILSFNATTLQPAELLGVGAAPRALAQSTDRETIFILQEEGLLSVNAETLQIGGLRSLPTQAADLLAIAGDTIVVGSQTSESLLILAGSDETLTEISLPWPVSSLVPLDEVSLLAVAAERTEMVRVALDTQSAGQSIIIGANLEIGAVVPSEESSLVYVTTPETEEVWRVEVQSGQASLLATYPGLRAVRGVLSADGAALYLSSGIDTQAGTITGDNPETTADVKSRVPPVRTTTKEASDADAEQEETALEEGPPALTMINTADGSVERELWQTGGISQLALDADRNILYALAPQSNAILVLDSRTLHVRNVVPIAVRPIAFTLLSETE